MASAAYAAAWADAARAAIPPPCGGAPQITDAALDGHHPNTDVVAAWLSEQSGRLQAVIQPRVAVWEPAHPDSDAAGFALLYDLGGQVRYVRAEAPRGAPVRFDYGTWTRSSGFASAGATTGEAVAGPGGAVAIDVPGVLPGAVLARPFVLTYDGVDGTEPHWVDRAPGDTQEGKVLDGSEVGADFVAGSCSGTAGGSGPGGGAVTTAVQLRAPRRLVGGGTATIGGRVLPARAGVAVEVGVTTRRTRVRRTATQADGSFSLLVPIAETTRLRAVAEGIGSQTRTVTVRSRVRIRIRGGVVRGTVRPRLPGRVLLLRGGGVEPTARTNARAGRFRIRLDHPRPGRYQAVFIPSGQRAERSTSNTGVIR